MHPTKSYQFPNFHGEIPIFHYEHANFPWWTPPCCHLLHHPRRSVHRVAEQAEARQLGAHHTSAMAGLKHVVKGSGNYG